MKYREIAQQLSRWYARHKRESDFRSTDDPYRIWLAEVLLQQTQYERGLEYYDRFITAFPDIESLARARSSAVMRHWEGLGYYSRAVNLHKTAKKIVRDYGGQFPNSYEALVDLPGVGDYTASAILSFAFGERRVAFDTNLQRIAKRLFPSEPREALENVFRSSRISSRKLNYALMDLGSTVCKSRSVDCASCPLNTNCQFFKSGATLSLPARKVKARRRAEEAGHVAVACCYEGARYYVRQSSKNLPQVQVARGRDARALIKELFLREHGAVVSVRPSFLSDEKGNAITRFYRCRVIDGSPSGLVAAEISSLRNLPSSVRERLRAFPVRK